VLAIVSSVVRSARVSGPWHLYPARGAYCRVRTVPNLRVADASVMPAIPRANINLTCIMIGEHVSDWMRDEA